LYSGVILQFDNVDDNLKVAEWFLL